MFTYVCPLLEWVLSTVLKVQVFGHRTFELLYTSCKVISKLESLNIVDVCMPASKMSVQHGLKAESFLTHREFQLLYTYYKYISNTEISSITYVCREGTSLKEFPLITCKIEIQSLYATKLQNSYKYRKHSETNTWRKLKYPWVPFVMFPISLAISKIQITNDHKLYHYVVSCEG